MRPLLAPILATLLAGCIDFREITEPAPPPPPPQASAEFHASLTLEDGLERTGVIVFASLNPGRGPDGGPRPIRDDTLRVSGEALAPTRVESDGTRVYEGWVPLPEEAGDGVVLRVSPPEVDARDGRPPVLYAPLPRRLGPDTLTVAPGEVLRLPFSLPAATAGPPLLDQGWSLSLHQAATHLSVSGIGAPPAPLVVPLDLIPPATGEPLTAALHVGSRTGVGSRDDGGYFVEIVSSASLHWLVRREAAPPAG